MSAEPEEPAVADDRGRTIHYGDRPEPTIDHDRTGLPDDCPCTAIRWCGQPPHIRWPEPDCPRHGRRPYGPDDNVTPIRRPRRGEPRGD